LQKQAILLVPILAKTLQAKFSKIGIRIESSYDLSEETKESRQISKTNQPFLILKKK
jgi:hypothetical protein